MTIITPRQELILGLVIREYVDNPKKSGVGSKTLVERYDPGFSAATIRNEMATLTKHGLLRQPYTSGGRIPTEEGYRYFVQRLVGDEDLPAAERRLISHQFHQARADVGQWSRLAASVLAHHTQSASLVTALHSRQARFKHLELIATHGRQVLMVLVLHGGGVRQHMLSLLEPVSQQVLSDTAARITKRSRNLPTGGIQFHDLDADSLEFRIGALVLALMRHTDAFISGDVVVDGLQNVLTAREFAESESARQALRLLEERSFLEDFFAKVLGPNIGGVQVVIAGEGDWEELRDCSMVVTRYGVAEVATGALAVFGPTRMAYGRVMGTVRYVGELLTSLVHEAYGFS